MERLEANATPIAGTRTNYLPLIAACVSGFLFQFDLSALSAALPDIVASLRARTADQAWIIDVYSLSLVFALPIAGPIADRYGRKLVFITGATVFAVSSVLCATAGTLAELLGFRVLQGVSGAALTSCASAYLAAAYSGPDRSWAFGIWGTVVGASMVAGPPVGALITSIAGWRWIFWINLPICATLLILIACTSIDQSKKRQASPLDWLGPASLAVTIASLAYVMMGGQAESLIGGTQEIAIVLCMLAACVFVYTENHHPAPAFEFALFGSPAFVAMCIVPIAGSIGFWALLVHLPQMARGPMGLSPEATGILLTALTIPMFLLPSIGARMATKIPPFWFFSGGLAIVGGADLLLAAASRDLAGPSAVWFVAAALLVSGSGSAMFNAQIAAAAVSAVPTDRAATASAICVTMRQIGFAFGIALIGALLQRGEPADYTTAFGIIGLCTLCLAAAAFVLLRLNDAKS